MFNIFFIVFIVFILIFIFLLVAWGFLFGLAATLALVFAFVFLLAAFVVLGFAFFEAVVISEILISPVRYGDFIFLNNISLHRLASPCGTLDEPSGGIPVTIPGLGITPDQFQIVNSGSISTGEEVRFGDTINLLFQGSRVVLKTDPNNPDRQVLFVDTAGNSPTANGNWLVSNSGFTGGVVNHLVNFNLIGVNGLFMTSCIDPGNCVNVSGGNCGNLIVGTTGAAQGSTWEFIPPD